MIQQPATNPTVLDLTAFYYSTEIEFTAAFARRDWDAIARLDAMEAALTISLVNVEAAAHAAQFDFLTGTPLSILSPVEEAEEDVEDSRDTCAAFDLDLAA